MCIRDSLHPAHLDAAEFARLVEGGVILPYLDIPVQHAADRVLRGMRRGYGRIELDRIFGRLREIDGLVLRTTVMTGFPGETAGDFRDLLDFLERILFDHVGVFVYSPEEGTTASGRKVSRRVALSRRDAVVELQMEISHERLARLEGRRLRVLVDEACRPEERPESSVTAIGRYAGQAYEIDGVTWLSGTLPAPGAVVEARVERAEAYDLFARIVRDFR